MRGTPDSPSIEYGHADHSDAAAEESLRTLGVVRCVRVRYQVFNTHIQVAVFQGVNAGRTNFSRGNRVSATWLGFKRHIRLPSPIRITL
jgi:hypothetical protein